MAAAKKKPIIRWTYYFGKKKIKTGPLKGGVKPGFIALQPTMASALGIKLQLPKDVPNTTYTVKDGVIYDTHPVKGGRNVSRPVKGTVGYKKVQVVVKATDVKAIQGDKASVTNGKVKGSSGHRLSGPTKSITVGIPAWASIDDMQTFLQGSKVISFSFNGGQYPVTAPKAGGRRNGGK